MLFLPIFKKYTIPVNIKMHFGHVFYFICFRGFSNFVRTCPIPLLKNISGISIAHIPAAGNGENCLGPVFPTI